MDIAGLNLNHLLSLDALLHHRNVRKAAEAMGVTSSVLEELGIVDETLPEPLGGAHRDPDLMAARLRDRLSEQLDKLTAVPLDELLEKRYQRLMSYGNVVS